jgi:hypothetical protein
LAEEAKPLTYRNAMLQEKAADLIDHCRSLSRSFALRRECPIECAGGRLCNEADQFFHDPPRGISNVSWSRS